MSLVALKKALGADGYNLHRNSVRVNTAVKRLLASGKLVQTRGTGAAGSFKLHKEKSAKVKKSTSLRKVVKSTIKSKATKKPAVKKVVRKISPKKPKRPIAAFSKRSSKSPAKVKKNVKKVLPKTKTTKPKSKIATKMLKKEGTLKKK
uniref:histone H1.11L-like n=1 Tax=Myxine glutinosa TaxID=7769 RepID=UPI00358FB51D